MIISGMNLSLWSCCIWHLLWDKNPLQRHQQRKSKFNTQRGNWSSGVIKMMLTTLDDMWRARHPNRRRICPNLNNQVCCKETEKWWITKLRTDSAGSVKSDNKPMSSKHFVGDRLSVCSLRFCNNDHIWCEPTLPSDRFISVSCATANCFHLAKWSPFASLWSFTANLVTQKSVVGV